MYQHFTMYRHCHSSNISFEHTHPLPIKKMFDTWKQNLYTVFIYVLTSTLQLNKSFRMFCISFSDFKRNK